MISNIVLFLSVVIGGLLGHFFKKQSKNNLKLILSFSGAYLLAISALHLLPEIFQSGDDHIGIYLLAGFIFQIVLEFFSKGLEHGHTHLHNNRVPMAMFVSLCIHALLEGMPVGNHQASHGLEPILIGIFLHKIPISIVLYSLFKQGNFSNIKIVIYLGVFAIMAPFGSELATHSFWISSYANEIQAVVVGVFLHIATTILFESTEGHRFNLMKLLTIISGVLLAWVSH
ncbi:MAG: zinc transporter ZupT [Flavobacteriales bacterium]|jgi:zinc transporter ZupT